MSQREDPRSPLYQYGQMSPPPSGKPAMSVLDRQQDQESSWGFNHLNASPNANQRHNQVSLYQEGPPVASPQPLKQQPYSIPKPKPTQEVDTEQWEKFRAWAQMQDEQEKRDKQKKEEEQQQQQSRLPNPQHRSQSESQIPTQSQPQYYGQQYSQYHYPPNPPTQWPGHGQYQPQPQPYPYPPHAYYPQTQIHQNPTGQNVNMGSIGTQIGTQQNFYNGPVNPGNKYGNVTARGNAKVLMGDVTDMDGRNPYQRSHEFKDADFSENAILVQGGMSHAAMRDFFDRNRTATAPPTS